MIFVFDSTPLIYLAKTGVLPRLAGLRMKLVIPKAVYGEVVAEGKRRGKQDALVVEKLASDGAFAVADARDNEVVKHLLSNPGLSKADAETLALARELKAVAVVDEGLCRSVAELEGISFHGSVFLLFLLQKKKIISKADLKAIINSMVESGWRCSTELYAAILAEIEKL
mgnify:CR=1 FL=1